MSCNSINGTFFKKHHDLIFSQLYLTLREHDILALMLTQLHKEHYKTVSEGNKIKSIINYEFNIDVLCKWFDIKSKQLAATLVNPCDRLSSKKIGVYYKNGNFEFIPLFSYIAYKDSKLTITPNHILIHDFILASNAHARVPHDSFRKLESEYTKRLFTLLCRFRDDGYQLPAKSIEFFHGFFGLLDKNGKLTKKTYAKTGELISKIIKPAILDIEEKEKNIEFLVDEKTGNRGMAYEKKGKKILKIKFLFKWRNDSNEEKEVNPPPASYDDIPNNYFDDLPHTQQSLNTSPNHQYQAAPIEDLIRPQQVEERKRALSNETPFADMLKQVNLSNQTDVTVTPSQVPAISSIDLALNKLCDQISERQKANMLKVQNSLNEDNSHLIQLIDKLSSFKRYIKTLNTSSTDDLTNLVMQAEMQFFECDDIKKEIREMLNTKNQSVKIPELSIGVSHDDVSPKDIHTRDLLNSMNEDEQQELIQWSLSLMNKDTSELTEKDLRKIEVISTREVLKFYLQSLD